MNNWQHFLASQDSKQQSITNPIQPQLVAMTQHMLLQVKGPDAVKFLQGQCTCDVTQAEEGGVLQGAHCNAKGRMISSFVLSKTAEDEFCLRMRADIAEAALEALKKYIVFSKANIAISPMVAMAILSQDLEGEQSLKKLPLLQVPKVGKSIHIEGLTILSHNKEFVEVWAQEEQATNLFNTINASVTLSPPSVLDAHLVEQGIVEITEATQEQYIPQALNYQLIDAISFQKGCYTGQEIIARMQYRGQLKKHTYRATIHSSEEILVGSTIVKPNNIDKTLGHVVASAHKQSKSDVLIATTENIYQKEALLIEKNSRAKVTWASLPYAIP